MAPSVDLVVARYREELNWLRRVPPAFRVIVYDKNDQPEAKQLSDFLSELMSKRPPASLVAVSLENVGREAHTYLYHMVTRYDSLADYTVFCQGKPFDHAFDFHQSLRDFAAAPDQIGAFRWLGHIIDTDDAAGKTLFQGWSKNEDGRSLDLRAFHQQLFGTDGPPHYTFVLGAQFAVSRAMIQSRPLSFYKQALAVSETFPDAAHCFERSWDRVFGAVGIDPDWLAGRTTVYLKPIRAKASS